MSDIEWTDETWNPVVGCDHVSEGCRNCYAETMSNRLASMEHSEQYDDVVDDEGRFAGGTVNTVPKMLEKPLEWSTPRRVFVNSMSDLFHPDVPFEFVDRVFTVMALADQHTFQILTKRPERMREYFEADEHHHDRKEKVRRIMCGYGTGGKTPEWPLPNVWLGVSVEDQDAADERIPPLLECPAEVRFLSCEPLLGPVNLLKSETGDLINDEPDDWDGSLTWVEKLDWVIAGGESGPGARPMHPDWVRSLRDQCDETDVAFHFKQWGAWLPGEYCEEFEGSQHVYQSCGDKKNIAFSSNPERISFDSEDDYSGEVCAWKIGKSEAGRELDGETHDEFPEVRDPC